MLSSPIQLPSLSIKEKRTSSVINASLLRVIRFNQNASFPIPMLAGFEFSIFWPYRSSIHEYANGRNYVRKKEEGDLAQGVGIEIDIERRPLKKRNLFPDPRFLVMLAMQVLSIHHSLSTRLGVGSFTGKVIHIPDQGVF